MYPATTTTSQWSFLGSYEPHAEKQKRTVPNMYFLYLTVAIKPWTINPFRAHSDLCRSPRAEVAKPRLKPEPTAVPGHRKRVGTSH